MSAVSSTDEFGPQHASLLLDEPRDGWARRSPSMMSAEMLVAERREPVIVTAQLTLEEVSAVLDAAGRMASTYDLAYGSAHAALFLHRGGYFGRELPDVLRKLTEQMRSVASAWPEERHSVDELTLRCIEFHTYQAGGALLDVDHRDTGSVVSMSVLLSDAAQLEGGRFVTWAADGVPVQHEVAQGDAVVFSSERVHNVSTLKSGIRHSLVLELWRGPANEVDRDG
tara:strand:+ start:1178 stop:1855 length:678 start_codon:yes stop_codon:yes gene_type:complete